MLTLPLEPTDDRADPLFKDAASCEKWLSQLQLTNLQMAHSLLLTQLDELNRYPMRGQERLDTLELLRETIGYVQDDYAKKITSKPLPLTDSELVVFVAIVQLWHALVLGYQRCLQAFIAGDALLARQGALLCQRCLLYSGLEIFEHLRIGYEFNTKLWYQLHDLYAFAEKQNFETTDVPNPLNNQTPLDSCRSAYVKILLACHARPAELSRSQLRLLDHWLTQWSANVTVERSYTLSKGDAPPLTVDLASTHGPLPLDKSTHSDSMRYLAMVPLSKLLRVDTILLQQGKSPQQVGLGNQGNSNECIEFLTLLHQCWCEEHNTRFSERRPVVQHAQLCSKTENIFANLSGRAFKHPGHDSISESLARKQIEAFGRVLKNKSEQVQNKTEFELETWHFENESILGARLLRKDSQGARLSYNQLVALRPGDSDIFLLGVTVWVQVLRTGQLQIGVRYLPGNVNAVTICATGLNVSAQDKYAPAFILQAVPALKIPPSMIVQRDWFKPDHIVEVMNQNAEKQHIKMGFSVERGIDYERVSFTPAQHLA